jgi:hypothetical protein
MRLLPRLVIVLVVCLTAISLSPISAQAQCGGPYIELSPDSGPPGTNVTVSGQGFTAGKYADVYYDGTRVATGKTDGSGYFTLFFAVPEGCKGTYQIQAVVLHDAAERYFTLKPGLAISPQKGLVGTNVTVTGQGFAKNEEDIKLMYYLNDNYEIIRKSIGANATGSWEINFLIPPSTKGEHRLDAQGAVSQFYEVQDATFTVTTGISLDKSSGSVGESMTMTGSRFVAYDKNIQILFDGQPVVTGIKADPQGDWEENFEVPEMPAGNYTVTAEGQWTKKEDINALGFEIKPDILLYPAAGHVGTDLTITGLGFAANKDVVILYDGSQKTTATTNTTGSFDASFVVPESQHGEHQVTIGYSTGSVASATFTLESIPPDTPQLISPADGGRVGLKGRVTPTFEWSEVPDDSGVNYNLEIATSANVTASGEFVDPIISVSGLVGTSYTVTEALPHGTYYWIVQAVDGAQNVGSWTAVRSFRVGFLPLWAFIVIVVAIVVLLAILIRALVVRRRYYY